MSADGLALQALAVNVLYGEGKPELEEAEEEGGGEQSGGWTVQSGVGVESDGVEDSGVGEDSEKSVAPGGESGSEMGDEGQTLAVHHRGQIPHPVLSQKEAALLQGGTDEGSGDGDGVGESDGEEAESRSESRLQADLADEESREERVHYDRHRRCPKDVGVDGPHFFAAEAPVPSAPIHPNSLQTSIRRHSLLRFLLMRLIEHALFVQVINASWNHIKRGTWIKCEKAVKCEASEVYSETKHRSNRRNINLPNSMINERE